MATVGSSMSSTSAYYLHYYFGDANISVPDFESIKRATLMNQTGKIRSASRGGGSNVQAQSMMLDMLHGRSIDVDLASAQAKTSYRVPKGGDVSVSQDISALQQQIQNASSQLGSSLARFLSQAKTTVQNLINFIGNNSSDIILSAVIDEANKCAQAPAYELCQRFLKGSQTFTAESGLGKFTDLSNSVIQMVGAIQSIENIQAGSLGSIEGLSYTSPSGSSVSITSQGQLTSVLANKIGGNMATASGALESIATMKGVEVGLIKAKKELQKALSGSSSQSYSGRDLSISVSSKSSGISEIETPITGTFGSGNGAITVTNNKVSMKADISTKPSKVSVPKGRSSIKVKDSTSLSAVLSYLVQTTGISWNDILHIAGSHEEPYDSGSSGGFKLATAWRDMVNLASIGYFATSIFRQTGNSSNIIMTYGGDAYWLSDLLLKSLNGGGDRLMDAVNASGGKQRYAFYNLNPRTPVHLRNGALSYQKNPQAAEKRSREATSRLYSAFAAQKVTLSLDMGMLFA